MYVLKRKFSFSGLMICVDMLRCHVFVLTWTLVTSSDGSIPFRRPLLPSVQIGKTFLFRCFSLSLQNTFLSSDSFTRKTCLLSADMYTDRLRMLNSIELFIRRKICTHEKDSSLSGLFFPLDARKMRNCMKINSL